ncbi:MAG: hypothetical protein HZB51_33345 [Chloroflexi bacterium]|nr:hypothetical protein [Chloroflexota bacterium]
MKDKNEFAKLEYALTQAGRSIAFPATPSFASNIQATLRAETAPRRTWSGLDNVRLSVALVFVVAFVFFVLPEPRDTFAQWLGLSNAQMTSTLTPTLAVASTPSPLASLTGAPSFQTTSAPIRSSTPSTQNHKPGNPQRLYPPPAIPQPTHP